MGKQVRQSSLGGGEIAPELYARTDIDGVGMSVRRLRNFIVTVEGSAKNRPGFEFIREAPNSDYAVRLIPFLFGGTQNYVLEFSQNSMRVIQNGAYVTINASAWSNATTYRRDEYVTYGGRTYRSINGSGNLNRTPPNATYWYDMGASTGFYPYEIYTPWAASSLSRLKFSQSGDTIIFTVVNTQPQMLQRYGQADWRLTAWNTTRTATPPTGLAVTTNTSDVYHVGKDWSWVVTAVTSGDVPEESLPSSPVSSAAAVVYPDRPVTVTWTAASGAASYNIFRGQSGSGIYGYIGNSASTTFRDDGQIPVYAEAPPTGKDPFAGGAGKYPQVPAYFAQRLWYANSYNAPQAIWSSKIGALKNFDSASPPKADDALFINIASRTFDEIRGMLPLNQLLLFCSGSEWIFMGQDGNPPNPTSMDARPRSYWGSSWLDPIVVGEQPLFVTDRDYHVREFAYMKQQDGAEGRDLTLMSSHLFKGHTIVDWAYSRAPFSTVWCVRDDGMLLSMGYSKQGSHICWGWHDTDGIVENVAVCPEGTEDVLYIVVRRTVNGTAKRFIERMATRMVRNARYGRFLDSFAWGDGTNYTATALTLTSATYSQQMTGTLTASGSTFSAGDVGKTFVLRPGLPTGDVFLLVTGYTSATQVDVMIHSEVPTDLRNVATTDWARAFSTVTGLTHLEGATVNVCGDGEPQGPFTVSGGTITLTTPVVHYTVGRPYVSEIELLDIYELGKGTISMSSMAMTPRLVREVAFELVDSAGVLAGESFDRLSGWRSVDVQEDYTYRLFTGVIRVQIESKWNLNGRAVLRQSDPLPVGVTGITRDLELPSTQSAQSMQGYE